MGLKLAVQYTRLSWFFLSCPMEITGLSAREVLGYEASFLVVHVFQWALHTQSCPRQASKNEAF